MPFRARSYSQFHLRPLSRQSGWEKIGLKGGKQVEERPFEDALATEAFGQRLSEELGGQHSAEG